MNWFTLLIAAVIVIFVFRLLSIVRSFFFRLVGFVAAVVAVWRLYIMFTYG
ncbi:hypothetical protein [Sporosarcina sp. USHLN248]|uniref:hypothetical protein n=1 Tax=Sporosarcina sp. USHLN248 TaxID=3081300 RepID=UPI003018F5B8